MDKNLQTAKILSENKIKELSENLSSVFTCELFDKTFLENVCVFACGSLARNELVEDSDLDLFFINNSNKEFSQLYKQLFFQKLYEINKLLKYKAPSKYGMFWDFISKRNLLDIGSQIEDYNNSFTARLLLILESKPLFNENLYETILGEVIDKYLVDFGEHKENFYPMYLINDIRRYWFTLLINFEFRRDYNDPTDVKNWKRLKIKYARKLTCYSLIACLFEQGIDKDKIISFVKMTPLERLDYLAIKFDLSEIVFDIKSKYDWFISLKSEGTSWWEKKENSNLAISNASDFHNVFIHTFMNKIYETNVDLKNKLDF